MKTKNLAIYQPNGAAAEYSAWACNLYNGCTHRCSYCYCRRGILAHTIGGDVPVIKKQLGGTPEKAFTIFSKELMTYREQIIADGGLFFSFSTDPMLREEIDLTLRCVIYATDQKVPCSLLTKATWWVDDHFVLGSLWARRDLLTIGFTLTGRDDMEPGADSNVRRETAVIYLHKMGFRTFVSMEPIIEFDKSLPIILTLADCCDEFRIGLQSPYSPQRYDWKQCDRFIRKVFSLSRQYDFRIFWKESIRRFYYEQRPEDSVCCDDITVPTKRV